ncbi:MAG: TcmI family type II polyketide cyclase [Micromonosporaceae bacterium]
MERVLIVARMDESDLDTVAQIWKESDETELPHIVGVQQRSLFYYQGLYFQLIEAEQPLGPKIEAVRKHPLFTDVNDKLANHIKAYDPETWRGPKDAMAHRFYSWKAA